VAGKVEHMDSIGNKGFLGTGDIQWMTAGSGIIHQEMPKPDGSRMFGFQLWVNLPSTHKMMKPRYQDIPAAKVPLVVLPDGVKVKVLAGQLDGTKGPVEDIILSPSYFDVEMPPDTIFTTGTEPDHTAFACIFEGEALFDETRGDSLKPLSGVLYEPGSQVRVRTGKNKARFILISGKPIREPVAWGGPIVMNTREELETAFREYREGTFIRK
ncbi:MAG TPA: pirin-like C-terminal cupin domain-containing protein, partial [Bacteroidales bacterium]|nr:pirin-like C-terminal cupin domain-containing protein [Bacteroidales bacterium]